MFKAEEFFSDHQIEINTSGKHSRRGWVQIRCPFCSGHLGWHGGVNIKGGFFNCWRCGYHWLPKVISKLMRIQIPEAIRLIKQYSIGGGRESQKQIKRIRPKELKTPTDLRSLNDAHRRYLKLRRFDADQIINLWGLKSTGFHGMYKHRIFIPVFFEWGMVSYQCLSPGVSPPYLACADENEIIPHKHIIY